MDSYTSQDSYILLRGDDLDLLNILLLDVATYEVMPCMSCFTDRLSKLLGKYHAVG